MVVCCPENLALQILLIQPIFLLEDLGFFQDNSYIHSLGFELLQVWLVEKPLLPQHNLNHFRHHLSSLTRWRVFHRWLESLIGESGFLYQLSYKRFYIDEIYDVLIVRPFHGLATLVWKQFDIEVVDGAVNGSGKMMIKLSNVIRKIQTGLIQHYASIVLLGVILIMIYLYLEI